LNLQTTVTTGGNDRHPLSQTGSKQSKFVAAMKSEISETLPLKIAYVFLQRNGPAEESTTIRESNICANIQRSIWNCCKQD